ncbi:soluble NSF attachment protein [Phakopsora pachyrhizi]|uniref:Soluble NSF attachment protein n=1 Tax=Phakopsora pachyrhizi TaxID=170000 RepID=A0AAV0B9K5_PHAPC|nr:soluble NSF attachment protein [Phakopsora pachyrhizi]CAH7683862.1 soluble NSF attachment protein [Phakopsora pachyrhizi]
MPSSANETLAKAERKLQSSSSGSFFGFGGSSSSKLEESRELFISAANQFKVEKCWKESGDCFSKAADCSLKLGEKDDAANDFWSAAKSYNKSHPELAIACYRRTVEILIEKGRFRQAADRQKEIGKVFQQDSGDLQGALDAFLQAAEWYSQEDAHATANGCYKDAADIAIQLENYGVAIENFELVAKNSLSSPLTRYSVKEYLFKASLCHLCTGDIVSTKRALEDYVELDQSFTQQREYKFLNSIVEAVEAGNQEEYTNLVAEFDSMLKLDSLKTSMLLKIKRSIQEEPDLL